MKLIKLLDNIYAHIMPIDATDISYNITGMCFYKRHNLSIVMDKFHYLHKSHCFKKELIGRVTLDDIDFDYEPLLAYVEGSGIGKYYEMGNPAMSTQDAEEAFRDILSSNGVLLNEKQAAIIIRKID